MAGVYPQRTREASRWDRHPNRSWQVDETWPRLLDGHIRLQVVLEPCGYSGHSLRAGLATSAATAGASERAIMNQTGHRSAAMVRRYIRDGSLFREIAAAKVGL